jgi:hypothetical protein
MAERVRGSSPAAFSRLKVSRQEMPASTRMRVLELETRAQFPRLPLASTATETPIFVQHTCLYCGRDSNFRVSRDFREQFRLTFLHS